MKESGRPAYLKRGKRINIYIDIDSLAIAKRLGSGNVSKGIRSALIARDKKEVL